MFMFGAGGLPAGGVCVVALGLKVAPAGFVATTLPTDPAFE
jgi:hypothetical protein